MKTTLPAAALLTAVALLPSSLLAQDDTAAAPDSAAEGPVTTSAGVYTAEQAKEGNDVFRDICLACHDVEEFEGLVESWEGETAYDLFDQLRNTMPEDAPGSLRRSEYVSLIAYLLEVNGVPTGDVELGTDADVLKQIVLEVPAPQDPQGR